MRVIRPLPALAVELEVTLGAVRLALLLLVSLANHVLLAE